MGSGAKLTGRHAPWSRSWSRGLKRPTEYSYCIFSNVIISTFPACIYIYISSGSGCQAVVLIFNGVSLKRSSELAFGKVPSTPGGEGLVRQARTRRSKYWPCASGSVPQQQLACRTPALVLVLGLVLVLVRVLVFVLILVPVPVLVLALVLALVPVLVQVLL
jgi:hypothetical protein